MLVEINRIQVLPGERLRLRDIAWAEFEAILADLGDRRQSRVAYHQGVLGVMSPSPEHELAKDFVSDVVKILLIEWDITAYPLGSTTFTKRSMAAGIEPDQCFYIHNAATVQGRDRLDLDGRDLPPDLAIDLPLEIDVTSRTHLDLYATLGVREVWRFRKTQLEINQLEINQLGNEVYVVTAESQFFPGIDLAAQISRFMQQARTESWNAAYKGFRAWAIANRPI
jgi:Uma2 family endonuclease